MALKPDNARHAAQIEAGTKGRKRGHSFEAVLADSICKIQMPFSRQAPVEGCLFKGNIGSSLLNFVLNELKIDRLDFAEGISAGALATAEEGAKKLIVNGVEITKCKSDVILTLKSGGKTIIKGVSVKQCSNPTPTNAQLYFSTATAFSQLLRKNNIHVSDNALDAMRMFCGDEGYRPKDDDSIVNRKCDPNRWFWEELPVAARTEWEETFTHHQDAITRLLLQKAYLDDPFPPDFLVHQTRLKNGEEIEAAIFTIDKFIIHSREYGSFNTRKYSVKKGSHKDPVGVEHSAPRFGVVQFQRGGQKQHPTQLQFNLKAGYFYQAPFTPAETKSA